MRTCQMCVRLCVCVCGGGLCEPVRWEEKGRGGGTQCSISHRPTAAVFSAEREKGRGRAVWREAVRVLSV